MNERIEQLIGQCIDQRWTVTGPMFDREKFAELIVEEACQAFWSEACHVSDLAYEEYSRNSKKIKQHFEVEL